MAAALGSDPLANELQCIRLQRLLQEDEWGRPGDKSRDARTGYTLRTEAEFRPIDLPSARGVSWRGLQVAGLEEDDTELRKKAMDIQTKLLIARMDETLGQIRTRIVDQANIYLQQIRSRSGNAVRGYHMSNHVYEKAQDQGKAVRIHAQIYNACRSMLERLGWRKDATGSADFKLLLTKYQYLKGEDLACKTETYSSTGMTKDFSLPWFWRMVPANAKDSPEVTRKKDEEFIADCTSFSVHARCHGD